MVTSQQTDFYETLGLKQSATDKQIKKAYRGLIHQYHPDTAKDATEETTGKCRQVLEAYEVLSDPQTKAAYDKLPRYTSAIVAPQTENILVGVVSMHVMYRIDPFSNEVLANVYVQLGDIDHLDTLPHITKAHLERVYVMNGKTEAFATCIFPTSICNVTDKLATYRRNQRWHLLTGRLHRR